MKAVIVVIPSDRKSRSKFDLLGSDYINEVKAELKENMNFVLVTCLLTSILLHLNSIFPHYHTDISSGSAIL